MKKQIIIAGGGMAGLSLAYFLSRRDDYEIHVFEKAPFWGGADTSIQWEHVSIERHYHHYFSHDVEILGLLDELGLTDQVVWKKGSNALFANGGLFNLAPLPFLAQFAPLSFLDRVKFILKVLKILRGPAASTLKSKLDKISAQDWAYQYFGRKISDLMWIPLLKSKFGSSFQNISASFLYGRIYNRVTSRKNSSKGELLGYLLGSSSVLINALIQKLEQAGVHLHLNTGINSLQFNSEGKVESAISDKGEAFPLNDLVFALQTPAAYRILEASQNLPKSVKEKEVAVMKAIAYQQVISVIVFAKKSFSKYYWTNISDANIPFPVTVEQTNLIGPEHYQGTHISYFSSYRDPGDSLINESDETIYELFCKHIPSIHPEFRREDILSYVVGRERQATPVYVQNFEQFMSPLCSEARNLFYLNGTQVYPESRNVNKMVSLGKQVLERIIARG